MGGNWYFGSPTSSVYRSAHLISSKRLTEYTDFPMPADYPHYPSHAQVLEYFRSYARHFGLYDTIQFGKGVARVEPSGWCVARDARRWHCAHIRRGGYRQWPSLGSALAELPRHVRRADVAIRAITNRLSILAGRRVLVVGAGNSGCDIAVEAAQHAAATFHSLRRGYHYLPKFLFGKPADVCGERMLRWRLPLWLRRRDRRRG